MNKITHAFIVVGLGIFSFWCQAEALHITTEFKPSLTNPAKNTFTNTTPISGFCRTYPVKCNDGKFSIETGITVSNKRLNYTSADPRDHTYQYLYSNWKEITLRDPVQRREIRVEFRLTFLSHRFVRKADDFSPAAFNGASLSPAGGCAGLGGYFTGTFSQFELAWEHPEGAFSCHKLLRNDPAIGLDFDDVAIDRISIGYELRSSSPLTLPNGHFRGQVNYTVGEGQEIDFGSGSYSDNELTIALDADIEHDLRVEHIDSNRVILEPREGWDNWSNSGQSQVRLEGESRIKVVASSPVNLSVDCEHRFLNMCNLKKDGEDSFVDLNLSITIPGMIRRDTGDPIADIFIPSFVSGVSGLVMMPEEYIDTTGTVKFWISEGSSGRIIEDSGSSWRGNVTLIFDASVPFTPY
ncbi:TPA: hypothetical protein ROG05_000654 [Enterobacter soli]|jgi:hypothetical protein|nr:hypothetical protein [Enterobacter soli]